MMMVVGKGQDENSRENEAGWVYIEQQDHFAHYVDKPTTRI